MSMMKIENKIIEFIKKNSVIILFVAVTLLGALLRYYCRHFISGDAKGFLLRWYDAIQQHGFHSLAEQVGDYNILYQFIICIFTKLPIPALYAYKAFSILFDYALAIMVALIIDGDAARGWKNRLKSFRFVMAYSAILMSPLVFMNSACWAQCDSIYTFFIFASLYAYKKEKYVFAFLLYGLAFSFKFQAIFALPFFIVLYFRERKFSILNFLFVPVMMIATSLPGIVMGRSILDPFTLYFKQVREYTDVSLNYNSFWNCVLKGNWLSDDHEDFSWFKRVALIFTLVLLGIILVMVLKNNIKMNSYRLLTLLHLTVYTCVLFLPTMHERYGYIYEITAIMLMFKDKKLILPGLGVILLSCITYGHFLFRLEYDRLYTSILNVLVFAWYVYQIAIKKKDWDCFLDGQHPDAA